MATANGSPIPVDQLPLNYRFLSTVQMDQEVHLAVSVVLLYEYFLTLDQEVNFIWKQSRKSSSILYICVRYFGTLYNLVATILMFLPQSIPVSNFALNLEPWAGPVIWWLAQGILQTRLYVLYHCSKKLLVFMVILFVGEVGCIMWMLISTNLLSRGTVSVLRVSFPGYGETDACVGGVSPVFAYIWIPCLVFEATLCLLAIYAGIKHSRGRSWWSTKTSRSRLIDALIQGNVIYFLSRLTPRFCGWQMLFSSEHHSQFWLVVVLSFRSERPIFSRTR
ncbi:hypothetical protein SCLCIDRAFT_1140030 [Scleroderma citrinum Foug A]|uniref:DUF6533 domain-containing protein n=1 Tax=Scleroderma citrinum Foug A TaxID=1036808 RepID=A0A0C3D9B7_9AGAM|nr:hypothetical protein SCLCIDRAFT_1140030 [Scleroderma citrinum Foug A]